MDKKWYEEQKEIIFSEETSDSDLLRIIAHYLAVMSARMEDLVDNSLDQSKKIVK